MVVFSGALLYWLDQSFACTEKDCPAEFAPAFESIPKAMWFAIVTIATVGYGDVTPHSVPGKVLASVLIVTGVCYMAMPLMIVGNNFTQVWDDRHRLLMRDKLGRKCDLHEMKEIWALFDPDGSGVVSIEEFIPFVESLELDLTSRGIRDLFDAIDIDRSNQLTFVEFLDYLFPEGHDLSE